MKPISRITGAPAPNRSPPVLASELTLGSTRLVPGGFEPIDGLDLLPGWPDAVTLDGIGSVAETLARAEEPLDVLPLVGRVAEDARLTDFELFVIANMPHLQTVCHRPRLLLRVEYERLAISRARRVPTRAVTVLASHPEDWESRTCTGVRPSRVLAALVEDLWDTYENRVAVRLVDHLLVAIGRRVEQLRRLAEMYDARSDFLDETRGAHRRQRRLFELWGEFFIEDGVGREISENLRRLARAYYDLQGLLDSPLYREIPRSATVPTTLRSTNVLANDGHYRRVAAIWRRWAITRAPAQTAEALRESRKLQCIAFDAFARLLTLRALRDLGYAASHADENGAVRFDGPDDVRLEPEPAGVLGLRMGVHRLRIVPLLCALEQADPKEAADRLCTAPAETLVLALGRLQDLDPGTPDLVRLFAGHGSLLVVLASPWSLDAIERLARVLGLWLAKRVYAGYPPSSPVRPIHGLDLPGFLVQHGPNTLAVSPGTPAERRAFEGAVARRREALLHEQRQARIARQAVDPGRLRALGSLQELASRAPALERLRRCPVCHDENGRLEPRVSGTPVATWWCVCPACDSEWGTRHCTGCQAAYPVLEASGASAPAQVHLTPASIDGVYGKDVWAEPCWSQSRSGVFRCTECGRCGAGSCAECAKSPR